MRALGLDLGTKSLGIAITDTMKIIASGVDNFLYANDDLNICIKRLKEVFEKYNNEIDVIVLGYPLKLNDEKNERTFLVEKFHELLKSVFPNVLTKLWDERYSTKNATHLLKYQAGMKASKIKKVKDKMSAVYILQEYLESQF